MSKSPEKIWQQIQNNCRNIRFGDFVRVIEWFGFVMKGGRGSHKTFSRSDIKEILDLQEMSGEAKPYQIKQFLRLVKQYTLKGGK